MRSTLFTLLSVLAPVHAGWAKLRATPAAKNVLFDGRIPQDFTLADFDVADKSPFGNEFVKGDGLNFSEIILFPDVAPSPLDRPSNAKAFELTIDNRSIFTPGGGQSQTAIRRVELSPADASVANNVSTRGTKTLHFSVQSDPQRSFNLSHEYQLVFLETAAFDANQFILKTGTLIGGDPTADPKTLVLTGNTNDASPVLFNTTFTDSTWHNFALQLNFDANTVQVFYSANNSTLRKQTNPLPNDLSGDGQYHFGIFKKPLNPGEDLLTTGEQEADIDEGLILGGLFMTDAANSSVTRL